MKWQLKHVLHKGNKGSDRWWVKRAGFQTKKGTQIFAWMHLFKSKHNQWSLLVKRRILQVFTQTCSRKEPCSANANANYSWCNVGKVGVVLLDGLPGLLLEAAVDGLGDGRLHQVDVTHHQGDEQVLQVFVERTIAEVSCEGRGQKKTRWAILNFKPWKLKQRRQHHTILSLKHCFDCTIHNYKYVLTVMQCCTDYIDFIIDYLNCNLFLIPTEAADWLQPHIQQTNMRQTWLIHNSFYSTFFRTSMKDGDIWRTHTDFFVPNSVIQSLRGYSSSWKPTN